MATPLIESRLKQMETGLDYWWILEHDRQIDFVAAELRRLLASHAQPFLDEWSEPEKLLKCLAKGPKPSPQAVHQPELLAAVIHHHHGRLDEARQALLAAGTKPWCREAAERIAARLEIALG